MAGFARTMIEVERVKAELAETGVKKGCTFARYARLLGLGKGDPDRGRYEAAKAWGADDAVVKAVTKSISTLTDGTLVPTAVAAEWQDMLRTRSRIRSIARSIPMPQGNLTMRRILTSATSYYVGETSNVTASVPTTGTLNWSFKKLVTLVPISNSLLRMASPIADELVRDDMLKVQASKEDTEFVYSTGVENKPVGILHQLAAANSIAQSGTALSNRMSDFKDAIAAIENSNVDLESEPASWLMSPRLFWEIYSVPSLIAADIAAFPFAAG